MSAPAKSSTSCSQPARRFHSSHKQHAMFVPAESYSPSRLALHSCRTPSALTALLYPHQRPPSRFTLSLALGGPSIHFMLRQQGSVWRRPFSCCERMSRSLPRAGQPTYTAPPCCCHLQASPQQQVAEGSGRVATPEEQPTPKVQLASSDAPPIGSGGSHQGGGGHGGSAPKKGIQVCVCVCVCVRVRACAYRQSAVGGCACVRACIRVVCACISAITAAPAVCSECCLGQFLHPGVGVMECGHALSRQSAQWP